MASYKYRGYTITNKGYYPPDRCVWWEAVDDSTNEASFHGHTLREVETMISDYEWQEKVDRLEKQNAKLREALHLVLKCKWTRLASSHGTEYGDDKEFDELIDIVSKVQELVPVGGVESIGTVED